MKILLDTQVWIWLTTDPDRLSKHAMRHVRKEANDLFLSAASAWEISIKWALGKLTLPSTPAQFVTEHLAITRTYPLAIQHGHALRVAELPQLHTDPFDRILIAQAQVEGMPILSSDPSLEEYAVDVLPC